MLSARDLIQTALDMLTILDTYKVPYINAAAESRLTLTELSELLSGL